jgi:hypothetical protein
MNVYRANKAFVYLWRDSRDKRFYLGYSGGKDKSYICSSPYMMKEYNFRPQDFKRKILNYGSKNDMVKLEQRLLKSRKDRFGKQYYNLMASFPNIVHTEENKRKISKFLKNNKYRLGKKLSEKHKQKIIISNINKIWSEESRKKISELKRNNKNMLNKNHSEETKRKMSESKKGENNFFYGKNHLKETKRKMSKSISKAIKLWHQKRKQQQIGVI